MQSNQRAFGFLNIIKNIPGLDADYAIEMIGGSEELYKMLLLRFTRLLPPNINDMDSSILTEEWGVFAAKVHGIKGSLRQIGNVRLAKAGEALEKAAKANDSAYCLKHYRDFKDELLWFYSQIISSFESLGEHIDATAEDRPEGSINDYIEALERVREALENYDSLLASEILVPLTKIKFGGGADELLAKTMESLELFQPQNALEYIMGIKELTTK